MQYTNPATARQGLIVAHGTEIGTQFSVERVIVKPTAVPGSVHAGTMC